MTIGLGLSNDASQFFSIQTPSFNIITFKDFHYKWQKNVTKSVDVISVRRGDIHTNLQRVAEILSLER